MTIAVDHDCLPSLQEMLVEQHVGKRRLADPGWASNHDDAFVCKTLFRFPEHLRLNISANLLMDITDLELAAGDLGVVQALDRAPRGSSATVLDDSAQSRDDAPASC